MIGALNYYMGLRLSFKKAEFSKNKDSQSKEILPERENYYFTGYNSVPDSKEPITSPNSGNVYEYDENAGPRFNGAYEVFFRGDLTY